MPKPQELRKSKRIYDLEPTFITLKDHSFRVNDISTEGIGIILEPGSPRFAIGERLEAIPIPLEAGPVEVKGVISHISVSSEGTRCGIMFQLDNEQFSLVSRFQQERKRSSA